MKLTITYYTILIILLIIFELIS
ncbi:hypothetical protein NMYAN_120028 [Nitrosomonas nitrosa]|uniref:Uncharacterized protein n=1 Tax=Nitrosomonas nitrosa TaxID=52442 RepID=A0A8H8YZF0_9PROT|nr:hypothetical protein NMYAN_120028 [Nitrosomonas nitrosa]